MRCILGHNLYKDGREAGPGRGRGWTVNAVQEKPHPTPLCAVKLGSVFRDVLNGGEGLSLPTPLPQEQPTCKTAFREDFPVATFFRAPPLPPGEERVALQPVFVLRVCTEPTHLRLQLDLLSPPSSGPTLALSYTCELSRKHRCTSNGCHRRLGRCWYC